MLLGLLFGEQNLTSIQKQARLRTGPEFLVILTMHARHSPSAKRAWDSLDDPPVS